MLGNGTAALLEVSWLVDDRRGDTLSRGGIKGGVWASCFM